MIAAICLAASCAFAQLQPPQNPQATPANQPAAQDQRGTAQSPLVIQTIPPKKTDADTTREQREAQEKADDRILTRNVSKLTVGLLFLQFIVIAVQAWIMSRQNSIFEGQSTIMGGQLTQATAAATAASDNAVQARRAANTAKKALLLVERADLLLDDVEISSGKGGALGWDAEITLVFKNCGCSRANKIDLKTCFLEAGGKRANIARSPRLIVGAGDKLRLKFPTLNQWMVRSTFDAIVGTHTDVALKFLAEINYEDVFGRAQYSACRGTFNRMACDFNVSDNEAS